MAEVELHDPEEEVSFFYALFKLPKTDYRALLKATAQSTTVCPDLVHVLRRAYQHEAEEIHGLTIQLFFSMPCPSRQNDEFADVVVARWATGGLFDVLESADCLLRVSPGLSA